MATEIKNGRSVDAIVEAGAGGLYHRAIYLLELEGTAYAVEEEFGYDEGAEAKALVEIVRELRHNLSILSLTEDAELSLNRECERCGAVGEPDCPECDGTGSVQVGE